MSYEEQIVEINSDQFKQHLISFLYAASLVDDGKEIKDIKLTGDLSGTTVPLKIIFEKGVKVFKF